MKLISEILKCTAKKGNISNLARGGFSENFIKKFNFRRLSIIPLVEKRIKILRAGIWWEFAHYRKAPKTAQNGWRRAGVVPNPEFTPRNTTTGVFEFWRLAGPKETRSGNFYSLFHSPVVSGHATRSPPKNLVLVFSDTSQ